MNSKHLTLRPAPPRSKEFQPKGYTRFMKLCDLS